jgi:hypothetical protein
MEKRTWRLFNIHIYVGFILALFCFGCTDPRIVIRMDKTYSQQLHQNPPRVIVLVPEKRIEFAERLYRVLWISMKENYYSFEGIWDPALFLRVNLVKALHTNFNLPAVPLWENTESGTYHSLVAASEASLNAVRKEGTASVQYSWTAFENEWISKSPDEYLKTMLPESIRSLKQTLGTDFILEVSISGISVFRKPPTSLRVFTYGRLIRLSDGAVIWLAKGVGHSRIKDLNEFSELEANNLALLKEHYERAVTDLFHPDNPSNLLKLFLPR